MSKIAIIGLNGTLGQPTIDSLESLIFSDKIAYPALVFTRNKSDKKDTDKIKYVEVSFDEEHLDQLYENFKGVDVIVELLGAYPVLFLVTEKIVAHVKPKLFIPSQFGTDLVNADKVLPNFLSLKTEHSERVRDIGIKTVDIYTSLFADEKSFLYESVAHIGIDVESKTATYRGDPDANYVTYSFLEDIGKVIVSVATTDPSKLPDTIRINSGVTSQRAVKEKYEQRKGVVLETTQITTEATLKELQEKYAAGFNFKDFSFYLHALTSLGPDKGIAFSKNDRELVNPGEALWKWKQY